MRRSGCATIGLICWALALPATAAGLTEAGARRFLAAQEQAWNAGRLDAYFAGFTPEAMFVDQTRTPEELIVYGRSTLARAKALAFKGRASARVTETSVVRRVAVAAGGRSARVSGYEVTTVTPKAAGGRARRICAETEQTLVWRGGRVLSTGQVDSIVRCPAAR